MSVFFDWLLILVASFIMLLSYKKIVYRNNSSIANYVIVVIYIFCVLPIILNYIVGIPQYRTAYWYKPFIEAMKNENVSVIYDVYVLCCMVVLYIFCSRKKVRHSLNEFNTFTSLICSNRVLSGIMVFLPIIYITLTDSWSYYVVYSVSSARGFTESNRLNLMTPCMLVSMLTFFSVIFKKEMNLKKVLITGVYTFVIVWISGKRFMLANILLLIVFYLVNMQLTQKSRRKIYKALPFLGIGLIAFSAFYLAIVRPMAEISTSSIYDILRVDFGRDDVIKYVINKEIIKHEHILDYYGETFLSLIGSFIPRKIWLSKPYPHYMYLTGSILRLDIHSLPAGTTPSLLEMTICNFSYVGFLIAVIILVWLCHWIDKAKDIDSKAIGLILMMALLTQSMDVYLILIVILVVTQFLVKVFKGHQIRLVINK